MVDLSLASQTMFAELLQRCLDAEFDALYNERGRFVLSDNEGTQVVTDRVLTPAFCLKGGVRHDAVAPILPQVQAA